MAMCLLLFCILCSCINVSVGYDVPKPKITVYEPMGIEIAIPNEEGVQLVSFHGNINKVITPTELGEISKNVYEKYGSFWIIRESRVALKKGDIMHFYIFVLKSGKFYRLDSTYSVEEGNTNTPKRNRLRRHLVQRRDVFVGDDNIATAGSTEEEKKFKPRFGSDHCFHHSHFHPHNPGSDSDLGHFHAHPYPHPHPHVPESGYIPHTPFSSGPSFFHPEHRNHVHRHFKHPKYPHYGHDFNSNYPISSNSPEDDNARDLDRKFDQTVTTEEYDSKDTENNQFGTSSQPEVNSTSSKLPDIDVRFKNEKRD